MSPKKAGTANIAVTGVGALSPVGGNAPQTCASLRAGISRVAEHAWYECLTPDPEWDPEDPLLAGSVSTLDPFLDGIERLWALAIPVLGEVCKDGNLNRADLEKCALLLSLPAEDEAIATLDLDQAFIPPLLERTGLGGCHSVHLSRSGHTGFFDLLGKARQLLEEGQVQFCLVGGIDSYLLESRLGLLDEAWRLRSQRTVDGFTPGEAAVILLLENSDHAAQRGQPVCAHLGTAAFGQEERPIAGDRNSTGQGLATAVAGLPATADQPFSWVLCDLNGETYRSYEWGLLNVRRGQDFADPVALRFTADCVGDVGAASGALLATWVCEAFRRSYAPADQALLWTAADSGRRAAITMTGPDTDQKKG